ncbi:MAG: amidohydrolase [Chloroflexi bacterium]|nr:amidohydrolase [Chloroflexota bacterium]
MRPPPLPGGPADLLILNARVVTMDGRRPRAEAVAVAGGRILAVGSAAEMEGLAGRATPRFDAQGAVLLPGIVDPHLHLLAYAAHLRSVELSEVRSLAELQARLGAAAGGLPPGAWLRGVGYDEWALSREAGRHPTREDLDAAVADRPVRIVHRSGHASVLNSLALERIGIGMATPEPPGGTVERAVSSGEPTGLLIDMEEYLKERVPPLPTAELGAGLQEASRRLLAWGITAVEDATPSGLADLRLLAQMAGAGGPLRQAQGRPSVGSRQAFQPALAAMVDARRLRELAAAGIAFGRAFEGIPIREAKAVLSVSSGRLVPSSPELAALVRSAGDHGYPLAIHAVEMEGLRAALNALEGVQAADLPFDRLRAGSHRIEHASVCPPDLLERLRGRRARVVTQPAFLYLGGDRYRDEVDVAEQPWLYRTTAFVRAGLRVAASSDAPVAPPDPRLGLYGAVARRSRTGAPVGADPPLSPTEALPLFTSDAAGAAGWGGERGRIAPGYRADLALWDRDLSAVREPEEVLNAQVWATFLGGTLVHGG